MNSFNDFVGALIFIAATVLLGVFVGVYLGLQWLTSGKTFRELFDDMAGDSLRHL